MGFFTLLKVASMPIVQMLIISMVGAFMATDYLNLLPPDARSYMNKVGSQLMRVKFFIDFSWC